MEQRIQVGVGCDNLFINDFGVKEYIADILGDFRMSLIYSTRCIPSFNLF